MTSNFIPGVLNPDGSTPTWGVLIQRAIDNALKDVHTWQPAIVVLVRPLPNGAVVVDLQPLLLTKFGILPAPVPLPIIQNCLVQMPRGNFYGMKLPVAVGDTGVALFCESSLDVWQVSGGAVDPLDTRHHTLSDAIFVPGLFPMSQPMPPAIGADPTELVVYNGLAQLHMQVLGGFRLTNGSPANEVLSILLQSLVASAAGFTALGETATATVLTALVTLLTPLVGVPTP